jgi:hypothetical protein
MLKRAAYFVAFLAVLMTAGVVLERTSSPFFQGCINQNEDFNIQPTAKENPTTFGVVVAIYIHCSGRFIDRHDASITALATIIIAAFTFTLWQSTEKLWRAGEKQLRHAELEAQRARVNRLRDVEQLQEQMNIARQNADAAGQQARTAEAALTQLERPYLFIFNVSRLKVDTLTEEGIILTVTYSVANYGKIPAIIKYAQAILAVGIDPPLPSLLPDNHTLRATPIFAAGEARHEIEAGYVWLGGSEFDEDGDTIPSIPDGSTLYLWVIITYRGPFTDQHETRACWIYNEITGRFIGPWGGPEYSGQK